MWFELHSESCDDAIHAIESMVQQKKRMVQTHAGVSYGGTHDTQGGDATSTLSVSGDCMGVYESSRKLSHKV